MNQTITAISEEINHYVKGIEERYGHDYSMTTQKAMDYIAEQLTYVKATFEHDLEISEGDEVFYFKHIKSHLLALILYYSLIQNMEMQKPPCSKKKLKKYYLRNNHRIKKKLRSWKCLYNYYKSGASHKDHVLFTRADSQSFVQAGSFIMEIDNQSTTPFVHIFAQIEAYDMLRHYLKKKIKSLDNRLYPAREPDVPTPILKWTAPKTDLTELIYALHASGAFNHGRADIKEIAESFQQTFEIELGQYNRTFLDIRVRKNNKTKFIDELKQSLIKKIKSIDGQLFL